MTYRAMPWKKLLSTNDTSTSFASKIPTLTEPTGVNVVTLAQAGQGTIAHKIGLVFFGAGNDDTTFEARLIGWRRAGPLPSTALWIPNVICQFACTLGTSVGVTGGDAVATDRFVDTLALASTVIQPKTTDTDAAGAASTGLVEFTSPANNLVAMAWLPLLGFQKFEVSFDMTGATNGNCFYTFSD